MDIIQTPARELGESAQHVENVVRLLDEGNTLPFIARYCGKQLFFVYSAANFELRLSKDFLHCLTSNVSKSLSLNASRSL